MTNALVKREKSELTSPERIRNTTVFTPLVDIVETDDELLLFADLPGVQYEDVDVRFENSELVIHGRCAPRQDGVEYLSCEHGVGDYYRSFAIGEAIDAERISAQLKNGVLNVHLPKSERIKPKRIAVKSV